MSDNSTKFLSINAVWASTACMFIFVILDISWKGSAATALMTFISLAMCSSAVYATKKICDVHAPLNKIRTKKAA